MRLDISFFVSSILSAYWNGAATYYRGLARALHERGHRLQFFEPEAFGRHKHRDLDELPWGNVTVYDPDNQPVREPDSIRLWRSFHGNCLADMETACSRVSRSPSLPQATPRTH